MHYIFHSIQRQRYQNSLENMSFLQTENSMQELIRQSATLRRIIDPHIEDMAQKVKSLQSLIFDETISQEQLMKNVQKLLSTTQFLNNNRNVFFIKRHQGSQLQTKFLIKINEKLLGQKKEINQSAQNQQEIMEMNKESIQIKQILVDYYRTIRELYQKICSQRSQKIKKLKVQIKKRLQKYPKDINARYSHQLIKSQQKQWLKSYDDNYETFTGRNVELQEELKQTYKRKSKKKSRNTESNQNYKSRPSSQLSQMKMASQLMKQIDQLSKLKKVLPRYALSQDQKERNKITNKISRKPSIYSVKIKPSSIEKSKSKSKNKNILKKKVQKQYPISRECSKSKQKSSSKSKNKDRQTKAKLKTQSASRKLIQGVRLKDLKRLIKQKMKPSSSSLYQNKIVK